MENFEWTGFLKLTFFGMKVVGLWPGGKDYRLDLYGLWTVICIIAFRLSHTVLQTVFIFTVTDIEAIMATTYIVLSEFLATAKACFVVKNMKVLKQLLKVLATPSFQPRNERQIRQIQSLITFWKWNSNIYWTALWSSLFFWATYPLIDGSVKRKQLPFMGWYPYDTKISPNFELTYLYQLIGVAMNGATALIVDTLIAALHLHIASQFDILCDDLRHISEEEKEHKELVDCIKHHQKILKFAKNCAKFTNWIVLGQFFISSLAIGITMFHLTTITVFSSEFFSITSYLISVVQQIFTYCYFGNEVEVKSSKIPYALFESDWTGSSVKVRKEMIIMTERCRKPLKVSALNLFYLSLDTFMTILRAAWSYFALLHQLTSEK